MSLDLVSPFAGWTAPAGATGLSQFTFVAFNAEGQLVVPTAGEFAVVLYDAPSIAASTFDESTGLYSGGYVVGENYTFVAKDFPKVIAGATLTQGEAIMTDNTGKAVAATSSNVVLGYAMSAASSGDLVQIAYCPSIHP